MKPLHHQRLAALIVSLAAAAAFAGCSGDEDGGMFRPGPGAGGEFSSPTLPNGGQYAHTFADSGTFGYHCGLHPTIMKGAAVVVSQTAADTEVAVQIVGLSTPGFDPDTARIKPGGTVRWTNAHGMNHSVESD